MDLINYNVSQFNNEWTNLNNFTYTDQYANVQLPLHPGFVTNYGMKDVLEDIATFFEEFMSFKYSQRQLLQYDPIMLAKFKLLYKILISFN